MPNNGADDQNYYWTIMRPKNLNQVSNNSNMKFPPYERKIVHDIKNNAGDKHVQTVHEGYKCDQCNFATSNQQNRRKYLWCIL